MADAGAQARCGGRVVIAGRRVKLFRIGRDQIMRIPRAFELPGADLIMRGDGTRLIIEPAAPLSLLALLAKLGPVDEEFDPITDPAPADV